MTEKPLIQKTSRICLRKGAIYVSTWVVQQLKGEDLIMQLSSGSKYFPIKGHSPQVMAKLKELSIKRPEQFTTAGLLVIQQRN